MITEIERYKTALEIAISGLRELGLDYSNHTERVEKAVDLALNPPPEYEEVTIERWAVIAPSGYVEATYAYEEGADLAVSEGKWQGYATAKLTGTLKRLKPRKAEKSVSGDIVGRSGLVPTVHVVIPGMQEVPPMGAKVTLTWTE